MLSRSTGADNNGEKSRIETVVYGGLMISAAFLGLGKNVVYAKILGATGLGYYSVLTLIAAYGSYLCNWGIANGLIRNISILRGRGEETAASVLRNRAAGAILLISLSSLIIYSMAILAWPVSDENLSSTLLLSGLFTVVTSLFLFGTLELRTTLRVVPFALVLMLKAGIGLLLGWVAAKSVGFMGVLVAETLVAAGLFFLIRGLWIKDFRFSLGGFEDVKELVKIGFPIMIGNFARNTATNIDRWFVAAGFGVAAFGQYSFGMIMATAGLVLLNIIDVYIGPAFLRKFGQTEDLKQIFKGIWQVSAVISLIFAIGWLPFIFIIKWAQITYFEEYATGISLMKIIYVGTMFQTINMFGWVLIAAKKTVLMMNISVAAGLSVLCLCIGGVLMEVPLAGFAVFYCFGRSLHFVMNLVFSWRTMKTWRSTHIKLYQHRQAYAG